MAAVLVLAAGCNDDYTSGSESGGDTGADQGEQDTGQRSDTAQDAGGDLVGEAGEDSSPVDALPDSDVTPDAAPDCVEGATQCRGDDVEVCEGGVWVPGACPDNHLCRNDECVEVICAANSARCIDEDSIGVCNFDGTEEDEYPCPGDSFCEDAVCISPCEPGSRMCQGDDVVECGEDGQTQDVVEECDRESGFVCEDGECISSCDAFDEKGGYIGCNYWGVDTPNVFGLRNVFAYVVSNVSRNVPAHVVVSDRDGVIILERDVEPLAVEALVMPHPRTMNISATSITNFGFRIETDVPITAYQFNPLQRFDQMGQSVASNDASLLLPDSALDTYYIGAAFTHWGIYASFLSILSTADGNEISVHASTATAAGDNVPALAAGEERTFTVDRGQVLTLKSLSAGGDLTGTVIRSDENVAVFGGVDCAQVPVGATFCDHIEEKIFPVRAWDTEYYATKFATRGIESDIWRVIASEDQTVVTTNPPQQVIPTLNEGEYFEFTSTEDFKIESDKPILVVQFMTGSSTTNSPSDGDPSMLQAVPARQFRRDYIFLVPDTYDRDWLTITYPDGAHIFLDGDPLNLASGTPIGDSGFNVVRTPVEDGGHSVEADVPVGVSVYGYDRNISYAYPAGLDLSEFGQD
jgi:hypothetical protein